MSKARLVLTALFVEHQTPAEVAARYGVHRAWVYKLKARYEAEGEAALEGPHRQRRHRRTAARAHHRHQQGLPAKNPEMTNTRTHVSVGSGVADVLRHHSVGLTGFEPAPPDP